MVPLALLPLLLACSLLAAASPTSDSPSRHHEGHLVGLSPPPAQAQTESRQPRILILGAGVAGIIAARTLSSQGFTNYLLVEAQPEIGGRLKSGQIGGHTVEFGANWIQGLDATTVNGSTGFNDGNPTAALDDLPMDQVNPILRLAVKHGLQSVNNDIYGSITTYDDNGLADYSDAIDAADDAFYSIVAGAGAQLDERGPDLSVKSGSTLSDWRPRTKHEKAADWLMWDFEYAQTPSQSSWLATAWNNNLTYNLFGEDNLLSVDQRGFKYFIQAEAATFLQPDQIVYNATVSSVDWSNSSATHDTSSSGSSIASANGMPAASADDMSDASPVTVTLANGTTLAADYVICTFSLGVMQNDDVDWVPRLPDWKREAVAAFTMTTYTKVFVQFAGDERFWFDTEMALYASPTRGRYPIWQSLDVPADHEPQFLPGSRTLFATIVGDNALDISSLSGASEVDVQEDLTEILQDMFPNTTLPDFDILYHDWAADPLFRGSYSNFPPSWDPDLHQNLRSSVGQGRLRWAGEAGSAAWFGFLHGAYADGEAVALELIDCIQRGGVCEDNNVPRPQGPLAPARP